MSNRMLEVAAAKIRLALSTLPRRRLIVIALALTCLMLPFAFYKPAGTVVRIDRVEYRLQIARTEAARQAGLGGQTTMPQHGGMLFVFDKPVEECFWMKDMHFPLDIVWLNSDKQVLSLRQNIQPNTYPQTFCPDKAALYVIELHAGEVSKRHMTIGQKLQF